jgi:hypothetical protein
MPDDIIGHGGGKGGSSHTHYEMPDSLHSISYARVLDLVSEGEILGLAKGLQSIKLDGTPLQNADNSMNFEGVTVDFRTGTQDQDYIAGFPDVENEIGVGVELKNGTPWVRAISNIELSAVRVTLGLDQLYKANTDNGDVGGSSVAYKIELATDGGAYAAVVNGSFSGKTMSAYQRSIRIDLPRANSGWQIRVSRLTPNTAVANISDKTRIISCTEVIDAKLRYPMSAIAGLQVDAKAFQSIPTRSYDMFGRIIQVPSNYDPRTRVYSGVWDGTFKPSWSDNPAWVFRDLVLSDRYGLGDRITPAQLDKWALYKIAQYCDVMVPDGKGGTEPRFTCNLYLQSRKQAYAVLQDIASIFRGISYWGGGSIIASADMPSDPVYVYTAANVIGGKFTRAGSSKATRYTVALVTWNDPEDSCKQKVEYVEDQEGIARYGIQQIEITAFGCTSQGQAHRAGRWILATSRLETEALTFDVGLDGAITLPGQIVRIADPSRMGRRAGGRIRSASGRVVVLDKAPVIQVGNLLTVILPTGVSQTRAVAAVAGDSVTVDSNWSTLPLAQSVWSVDSNELSAPLFRVISVTEKDELTYSISAIQHEPGKYDFVENGTAITPRNQTALDVTTQAPPTSVTLAGYTVSLADVQKLALQVSCAPVAGAVAYEGAYRRGDDNWIAIPRQPSPTMDVLDVLAGTYMAKMAAVNSIGVTSVETLSVAVEIARDGASKNADILLGSDAPYFHTNQAGQTDPSVITFTASLIALDGPVTWSCVGGTLTNKGATTAQLKFADMSAASAEVTASVTAFGRVYSKALKVGKLQDGAAGTDGLKTGTATLYRWSTTAPAKPTGTSTFTWAGTANTAYAGTDGWYIATALPVNPGTPGMKLYVASVGVSAAANAATTSVGYSSSVVMAYSSNGADGVTGLQAGEACVYTWAATLPASPVGSATFKWSDGTFGAAPAGWQLTPGTSPTPGYTLWKARVGLVDSASVTTTDFNWGTQASITAAGFAGAAGAPAMWVDISSTGQVFSRADSTAAFAPTSLTLTATANGGAASAYQWQYWSGTAWVSISGATAATYAVASGSFTSSRVFRVQATIAGTVYVDEITLVQVTGGANGVSAITGFLTNESAALAADNAGVLVAGALAAGGGTFKVFDGVTDKTGTGVTYSVASETGCDVSITTAGVYTVVSMSADQAFAVLQATYGGVTIQKQLSLSKARAGATGLTGVALYTEISTSGGQVFSRATSAAAFAPTSITLTATPYGAAASSYQWQYWSGTAWTNIAGATTATYSVASGAFTGSRVFRVVTTINGTAYYDEMTLVQVTGGLDGVNAITGFLTNESAALAATNAGVVSDFSPASGTFRVYDGITDKTGAAVTYSVASQTGCTVAITTAGVYSVSAMSADQGTATLQAVYGGVSVQKTLSVAKARAGAGGTPGVAYYVAVSTSGGQVFSRADSAGTFAPTSITLTANPYGGSATYQWQYWSGTAWTNIAGATGATYVVTSGAFTTSRVFRAAATINGSVYYDEMTLVQVTGGSKGADGVSAITGFLTNENTTLAATSAGVVSSFATAAGTFKVYEGATDKTGTAVTYSVATETGCDVSITTAGAYSVVSMSADQATATLQAVYGGVTIQKQLSLSKARAGTSVTGAEGSSYVTAYCASTSVSTSTAPAATAGRNSVPVVNGGGVTGTWVKTVPTLANDQRLWQTDGIYNPANDTVTWSIPYVSSAKYGSLSALVANLGYITAGEMHGVSLHGGAFTSYAWPAPGGTGFYLGPEGLLLGNAPDGRFFLINSSGELRSPNFTIIDGIATFSGVLSAATGNFTGSLTAASGTLGSLTLANGGNVRSANSNGWGYWPSAGQGGIMYLGAEGFQLGNYNDGKYLHAYANGNLFMPGFAMQDGQLTLTSPIIVQPQISNPNFGTFSVSLGGNWTAGGSGKIVLMGSRSASITGGTDPKTIRWSLENSGDATIIITAGQGTATVTLRSNTGQAPATGTATLTCTVTSANGLSAVTAIDVTSNHN